LRDTPTAVARVLRIARWAFYVSLTVLIVLFIVSPGLSLMDSPWSTLGVAAFSVFFTSLIALCLRAGPLSTVFENRALRWIGTISYGIYVYHLLLYSVFEGLAARIAPRANPFEAQIVLMVVAACGTLLIASLSFYTFERAFLSLKEKLAGQGGGAKTTSSPQPMFSKTG
jgi:peptidoglycan/LPS O-acetylase OafA/YrhL